MVLYIVDVLRLTFERVESDDPEAVEATELHRPVVVIRHDDLVENEDDDIIVAALLWIAPMTTSVARIGRPLDKFGMGYTTWCARYGWGNPDDVKSVLLIEVEGILDQYDRHRHRFHTRRIR